MKVVHVLSLLSALTVVSGASVRQNVTPQECGETVSLDFSTGSPKVLCASTCKPSDMQTWSVGSLYKRPLALAAYGLMVKMDYKITGVFCSLVGTKSDLALLESFVTESGICKSIPSTTESQEPATELTFSVGPDATVTYSTDFPKTTGTGRPDGTEILTTNIIGDTSSTDASKSQETIMYSTGPVHQTDVSVSEGGTVTPTVFSSELVSLTTPEAGISVTDGISTVIQGNSSMYPSSVITPEVDVFGSTPIPSDATMIVSKTVPSVSETALATEKSPTYAVTVTGYETGTIGTESSSFTTVDGLPDTTASDISVDTTGPIITDSNQPSTTESPLTGESTLMTIIDGTVTGSKPVPEKSTTAPAQEFSPTNIGTNSVSETEFGTETTNEFKESTSGSLGISSSELPDTPASINPLDTTTQEALASISPSSNVSTPVEITTTSKQPSITGSPLTEESTLITDIDGTVTGFETVPEKSTSSPVQEFSPTNVGTNSVSKTEFGTETTNEFKVSTSGAEMPTSIIAIDTTSQESSTSMSPTEFATGTPVEFKESTSGTVKPTSIDAQETTTQEALGSVFPSSTASPHTDIIKSTSSGSATPVTGKTEPELSTLSPHPESTLTIIKTSTEDIGSSTTSDNTETETMPKLSSKVTAETNGKTTASTTAGTPFAEEETTILDCGNPGVKEQPQISSTTSTTTTTTTTTPAPVMTCPAGYIRYADSCYHISSERGNWEAGEKYCRNKGGAYVTISSDGEQNFVKSLLKDSVWIGYNDRFMESSFGWSSGEKNSGYKAFANGEPNNGIPYGHEEDCVEMRQNLGYYWNDEACWTVNNYACETGLILQQV